jgi:hypothetical protein
MKDYFCDLVDDAFTKIQFFWITVYMGELYIYFNNLDDDMENVCSWKIHAT